MQSEYRVHEVPTTQVHRHFPLWKLHEHGCDADCSGKTWIRSGVDMWLARRWVTRRGARWSMLDNGAP